MASRVTPRLAELADRIRAYDGPPARLMEVCGTHTASIFRNGVRDVLPPQVRLVSGPGCPVCVTSVTYIDRAVEAARTPGTTLLTFGDMRKVPGRATDLAGAAAQGGDVALMLSPLDALALAAARPDRTFVVSAVGFETTAPAYALLLEEALSRGIRNLRLLTSLRTIVPALDWLCANEPEIDGYLAPGHVSVVLGSDAYRPLADRYARPFAVAGFDAEGILAGVLDLLDQRALGRHAVRNLYPTAVRPEGNPRAREAIDRFFEPCDAWWRGLGRIPGSGLRLRPEHEAFAMRYDDAASDAEEAPGCRCGEVVRGRCDPGDCPLFATACTPRTPVGPCMVSPEGACGIWHRFRGTEAAR